MSDNEPNGEIEQGFVSVQQSNTEHKTSKHSTDAKLHLSKTNLFANIKSSKIKNKKNSIPNSQSVPANLLQAANQEENQECVDDKEKTLTPNSKPAKNYMAALLLNKGNKKNSEINSIRLIAEKEPKTMNPNLSLFVTGATTKIGNKHLERRKSSSDGDLSIDIITLPSILCQENGNLKKINRADNCDLKSRSKKISSKKSTGIEITSVEDFVSIRQSHKFEGFLQSCNDDNELPESLSSRIKNDIKSKIKLAKNLGQRKTKSARSSDSKSCGSSAKSSNLSVENRPTASACTDDNLSDEPEIFLTDLQADNTIKFKNVIKWNGNTENFNENANYSMTVLSSDSENETQKLQKLVKKRRNVEDKARSKSASTENHSRSSRKVSVAKNNDTTKNKSKKKESVVVHDSSMSGIFPSIPWNPILYNKEDQSKCDTDINFLSLDQFYLYLSNPIYSKDVMLCDTRDYRQFEEGHIILAKHLSHFMDDDGNYLDKRIKRYCIVIFYDHNDNSFSLLDSNLSKIFDYVSNNFDMQKFVLRGGFEAVLQKYPLLHSKKLNCDNTLLHPGDLICAPTILSANVLYESTEHCDISKFLSFFNVTWCISFEKSFDLKLPNVQVTKIVCKSLNDFVEHFECMASTIATHLETRISENSKKSTLENILILCTSNNDLSALFVIGYLMLKNHWTIENALQHYEILRGSGYEINNSKLSALQQLEERFFNCVHTSTSYLKQTSTENESDVIKNESDSIKSKRNKLHKKH